MGMLDLVIRAAKLAIDDPRALKQEVQRRLTSQLPPQMRTSPTAVSQTLEEVVADARALGLTRLGVCGDTAFRQEATAAFGNQVTALGSVDFTEVQAGASRPVDWDLATLDGIVVGGRNIASAYVSLIRILAERERTLPVLWVGKDFELAIGSLPVAKQIEKAQVHLFNHLAEYFLIKDPVLARLEVCHGRERDVLWRILKPNQTMTLDLAPWLQGQRETVNLTVRLTHPAISRGRHVRWRFWGDLQWKGSLTSIHGLHDDGPARRNAFRVSANRMGRGTLVATLPVESWRGESDPEVTSVHGAEHRAVPRMPELLVDQSDVELTRSHASEEDVVGWKFPGFGGSMWYALEAERSSGGGANLSANHMVSGPLESLPPLECPDPLKGRIDALRRSEIIVNPHALPVLAPGHPLELGFSFASGSPIMRDLRLFFFDNAGGKVADIGHTHAGLEPVFANELAQLCPNSRAADVGLVMVAPDWETSTRDPSPNGTFCELVARLASTGDYDVTEFQNAWRNMQVMIPELPHWLHPAQQLTGRTNVCGRALPYGELRTGLVLVNAAGWLGYRTRAEVTLKVYNAAGQLTARTLTVPAFTHRFLWLDEVFSDLNQHLGDAAGAVLVQSSDADMTVQITTMLRDRSVSLQHLWGY